MVHDRPQRPNRNLGDRPRPQRNNQGGNRNNPPPRNRGSNGGGGNPNQPPSPWLNPKNEPSPDSSASFVEYLRWMRPADYQYKDVTKTQILQMATDKANYDASLKKLNQRTELIAGKENTFTVSCPWRIRVGGHRGPESILLPAFNALGIPFIPSSTLRGVARTQAIRQIMAEKNCDWQTAEKDGQIVLHFGALDADKTDQAGKIVFLDAYPIAGKFHLEMDMANNIWSWDGDNLKYSPNPNPFLSLKETSFLIGLKLVAGETDQQLLKQVKDWLLTGLVNGAGSQINTGYGQLQLLGKNSLKSEREFLKMEFTLEGQLIHGYQKAGNWNYEKNRFNSGISQAEVRPTAFKSMLRYWFRIFALGVITPSDVSTWEATIFGSITPPNQKHGYLQVNTEEKLCDSRRNRMQAILRLSFSNEITNEYKAITQNLLKDLTWLTFNLGGIGQGARRPLHNRSTNPRIRGSQLEDNFFAELPDDPRKFARLLQEKILSFYENLFRLIRVNYSGRLLDLGGVEKSKWKEVADTNCRIIIVSGESPHQEKGLALATLHSPKLKPSASRYDENLCGTSLSRPTKPSPVWIREFYDADYEVVTIFGISRLEDNEVNPRLRYLSLLKQESEDFLQVFPLKS